MTDINLLPSEEKPLGKFLTWILTYGRYIIISTEIIVLIAFLSRFKLDGELTDLHQSIAQRQAVVLAAYDLEQKMRNLQNQLLLIRAIEGKRSSSAMILTLLEKLTPEEVVLKQIDLQSDQISLEAVSLSSTGFTSFLNSLSETNYFTDLSLDELGKEEEGGGTQFRISANIKTNHDSN